MNDSPSTAIEALRILTDFLSNNSIAIVFLALLYICRDAISNLITRLTSVTYKNRDSEVGMVAAPPLGSYEKSDYLSKDEKPSSEDKDKDKEIDKKEEDWFDGAHNAFCEGRLDDAEAVFKKYALGEKDEIELERNRAIYLCLRFEKGKDNSAIGELEQLARTAKTEESKFNTLMWLSFCLRDGMQYHRETEMWRQALEEVQLDTLKTRATVKLAYSLNNEGSSIEAKKILLDRLLCIEEDAQKGEIFEALSSVEESLGNKSLSVYCKDKSLEFDPNNRDELFNSAYSASIEKIDEISISNYLKLIRIDGDNSIALNNLGARAQEIGLKIKAIDQYKKSSCFNNTLAMANQGYLLLGAGFTDEAEKIALEALEKDNPHKNIHSLLAEIKDRREEQDKKWEELGKKALNRQKMIREYTEQFYLGKSTVLIGDWELYGSCSTTIKIDDDLLKATWVETKGALNGGAYKVEIIGKVAGSTFEGTYSRMMDGNIPNTLVGLGGITNKACIGYLSERDGEIKIISKEFKDDLILCLSRKKG